MDPYTNDDDSDLSLSIPIKSIYEEFLCPICFSTIQNCLMTPCGHNFCESCILECINRKHSCPCCNKETIKAQLVKNHHFDKILAMIDQEKDEASKHYFASLLNNPSITATTASVLTTNTSNVGTAHSDELSPIEHLFQQHMKKSLVAYEEYFKELKKKFNKAEQNIRDEFITACKEIETKYGKEGTSRAKEEKAKLLLEHKTRCDLKLNELSSSWTGTIKDLADNYDQYLTDRSADPRFLPINVTLTVPNRFPPVRLDRVIVRPTDSARDVFAAFEERLKLVGNPIMSLGPSAYLVIRSPLLKREIKIDDPHKPVLQYNPPPGCEIELNGNVVLESDKPKECFTATFRKDAGQVCNYYTCKDCKYNWICGTCAAECHKGHTIVEYIMNHKPTWACCYCMKNKSCKIPNSKTKAK